VVTTTHSHSPALITFNGLTRRDRTEEEEVEGNVFSFFFKPAVVVVVVSCYYLDSSASFLSIYIRDGKEKRNSTHAYIIIIRCRRMFMESQSETLYVVHLLWWSAAEN
jgi:hypothetical protein